MAAERGHWKSRVGFILAAAGSAVGLGNLWKFPYVAGENGGGAFVLVYLACIALVGLPIMMAEVLIGRMAQTSPVGAFPALSREGTPWKVVGVLGVLTGFVILSYYSVVAGWALHYVYLSVMGEVTGTGGVAPDAVFGQLYADPGLNLFWHAVFMAATISIVLGGIERGVERAARILMPALFVMMGILLAYASSLDGFARALDFVFGFHTERLTSAGVLEALGHSFFTLSLGMGAMLTYGSYMQRDDDVVSASVAIAGLDTLVALMACMILFPITFSQEMEAAAGPGLVFINMPVAFGALPGGGLLAVVFFVLLTFAALTSAISLLEVVASYFIDRRGWSRKQAVLSMGLAVFLVGIPSALSGGTELFGATFEAMVGKNWFDAADYLASNWMLPLGGLGTALFMAWAVGDDARRVALAQGSRLGKLPLLYLSWLRLLRWLVPVAIVVVMLHALGALQALGLTG